MMNSSSTSATKLPQRSSFKDSVGSIGSTGANGNQNKRDRRRRGSNNRLDPRSLTMNARSTASTTIRCNEKEDRESILASIQQTKRASTFSRLVVEDLLTTTHTGFLSSVEALVFSNDREWQSIRFNDTFDLGRFPRWEEQKAIQIRDYEALGVNHPSSKLNGVIEWRARITVPVGTDVEELMYLFKDIKEDPDIYDMKLNGGLSNPGSVADAFDWRLDHTTLGRALIIELECGWINEAVRPKAYKKFLNVCLCRLKEGQRHIKEEIKQIERAKERRRSGGGRICPMRPDVGRKTKSSRSLSTRSLSARSNLSGSGDESRISPTKPGKGRKTMSSGSLARKVSGSAPSRKSRTSGRAISPNDDSDRSPDTVVVGTQSDSQPKDKPQKDDAKYWRSAVDSNSGKTYYYHKKTKETRWVKPAEMEVRARTPPN